MMKLSDVVKKTGAKALAGKALLDREVKGGYAGDMLSDVLASAGAGALWMTVQAHPNIVAVAVMKGLAGVLLVNGKQPEKETLEKAEAEKMPLLSTSLDAFQASLRLQDVGKKA